MACERAGLPHRFRRQVTARTCARPLLQSRGFQKGPLRPTTAMRYAEKAARLARAFQDKVELHVCLSLHREAVVARRDVCQQVVD